MSSRRGTLSDSDRTVWSAFVRTITALGGRSLPPGPEPAPLPAVRAPVPPKPTLVRPAAARQAAPIAIGGPPADLDAATYNRFRTGKLPATRILDLHGRTAQQAHHALQGFLVAAQRDGVRCVEVITGRGSNEIGVIRRELPFWLNQPDLRRLVLAAAHPHAANPGSVRLLLRRIRVNAPRVRTDR